MLMGEERAAMVFTDPPYNVPIDGHASGLARSIIAPFRWPRASGQERITTFLGQAFRNLAAFSGGGALHFVCMACRVRPGSFAWCHYRTLSRGQRLQFLSHPFVQTYLHINPTSVLISTGLHITG